MLLALVLLFPQQQEPRDLAPLLAPIRVQHEVPALAAAVLEGRQVTSIGAVGVRRLGDETPVKVDDCWHLGSCGKAMTATAVARFVEAGRLRWNTTLAEALPGLAASMHAQFRTATVRQLLDHRAGLPKDTAAIAEPSRGIDRGEPLHRQRLAIAAAALAEAPAAPPGTAQAYSNTGYVIAGAIVEEVAKLPWEQVMRDEVFAPLGMHSAGFGPPGRAGTAPGPWGHLVVLDRCAPTDPRHELAALRPFYGPSGDVHASLRDWARFVAAHFEGDTRGLRLLSTPTLDAMHQPVVGADYACGFAVNGTDLAHHGSSPRWHALVRASLERRVAFLAVCNVGDQRGSAACEAAVAALAALPPQRAKGR